MRTPRLLTDDLIALFHETTIATMSDLKAALGTNVDVTVFRKLKELDTVTSYSHRGCYHTLTELAAFDNLGLWSYQGIHFSRHGTLLATTEHLVNNSEAGFFARELKAQVHVNVDDVLTKLVRTGHLAREKISGRYVYCSKNQRARRTQLAARQALETRPDIGRSIAANNELSDELMAAIVLFFAVLDEKQRRLYAGLESLKLGHGGDRRVADLLGLDVKTIARGRRELRLRETDHDRIRKTGAGRPSVQKKRRTSSRASKR